MIDRYSLPEMSKIWDLENRFSQMLVVEKTVAKAQAELGLIPKSAAREINSKAQFSIKGILKKEKTTLHDVGAFVQEVAQNLGENHRRYLHYGLTSSDVLDTSLSLQIRQAQKALESNLNLVKSELKAQIIKHKETLCSGRTHGMHAEPTSFGYKLLGYYTELLRVQTSFQEACSENIRGKLSGAVGAYHSFSPQLESLVCKKLNLKVEPVSTQVIPRDRHARILFSLSLLASLIERLSLELRHLQRTEVAEVSEGFSQGQQGSSAMPHKKNPISAENLTGLARLIRSYIVPALENTGLWHERDISHSSVERVIFPDAFILSHYACHRMAKLLKNLKVSEKRMQKNMQLSGGQLFSSRILTLLIKKGLDRNQAYQLVQKVSHNLKPEESFENKIRTHKTVQKYISKKDLDDCFLNKDFKKFISKRITDILSGKNKYA